MELTEGQVATTNKVTQLTGVNLAGIEEKAQVAGVTDKLVKKITEAQTVLTNSDDEDEATPILANIAVEILNLV